MFILTNVSEDECGDVYAGEPMFFEDQKKAILKARKELADDFDCQYKDIKDEVQEGGIPYVLSLNRDGRFEAYTVAEIPEPKQIKVQTPSGELIAEAKGTMDEYPGFYIYKGTKSDILAVVEYDNPDEEFLIVGYSKNEDLPMAIIEYSTGKDRM